MENRKTFINFWSEFLHQKGLSNYQSVKAAIVFADQIQEVHSQAIARPIKSNDVGDVEKAADDYSEINYAKAAEQDIEDAMYIQAVSNYSFKAGAEWQSKQQPINPITIKNFITMVKNSDAEIKKLVMDELGCGKTCGCNDATECAMNKDLKEPVSEVSDAVEFDWEDEVSKMHDRLCFKQGDFEGTLSGILTYNLPEQLKNFLEEKLRDLKEEWKIESEH